MSEKLQGGLTYLQAGVDLDLGDECSKIMFEASRNTWKTASALLSPIHLQTTHFGALRYAALPTDENTIVGVNSDGIGTKVELAERLANHTTVAHDLFAMVCDDATVKGAEPLILASVLDFNRLNREVVTQLAQGMCEAARLCNVAVMNGEIAELGTRVGGYGGSSYNWSATVLWIGNRERINGRKRPEKGNYIVAVSERSIRSNGLSLFRRIVTGRFGHEWHESPEGKALGQWALLPSIIYTPLLRALHGGFQGEPQAELAAAVHVTGGGVPGKLKRILEPLGLGATIDDLFDPPREFLQLQEYGDVQDREAYRTWNMGQGLLVVGPDPKAVIAEAEKRGLDAKVVGRISDDGGVTIRSKGCQSPGQPISF
jgi:phosphoribosylformylglycinamidine cyclo-ligase